MRVFAVVVTRAAWPSKLPPNRENPSNQDPAAPSSDDDKFVVQYAHLSSLLSPITWCPW